VGEHLKETYELTPEEEKEIKWVRTKMERKLNRENSRETR
jgi:hypothetical protein